MTDDPFLTLIVEALNLMHPRFAAASAQREFYHQFRRLWDKALPVQLGLGHVMIQDDPAIPTPRPDFLFWQLGEHGQPDRRLGAVAFASLSDVASQEQSRTTPDYPYAVCVIVGRQADIPPDGLPSGDGITTVFFDTERWQAHVLT